MWSTEPVTANLIFTTTFNHRQYFTAASCFYHSSAGTLRTMCILLVLCILFDGPENFQLGQVGRLGQPSP